MQGAAAEAQSVTDYVSRAIHEDRDARPSGAIGALSRREHEVLGLVTEGMTNAQIAQKLYLSPRTVSTHLTSIYQKLGVASRGAAARLASEHNPV